MFETRGAFVSAGEESETALFGSAEASGAAKTLAGVGFLAGVVTVGAGETLAGVETLAAVKSLAAVETLGATEALGPVEGGGLPNGLGESCSCEVDANLPSMYRDGAGPIVRTLAGPLSCCTGAFAASSTDGAEVDTGAFAVRLLVLAGSDTGIEISGR